jgi:alkylhydroperoxidase/carboxymuconolactone decarboxylase family protein YurZ
MIPSPAGGEGWAGMRAALEVDGALTAGDKALILVAVATTRGRPAMLEREVARARELAAAERLPGLCAVVGLARGREAADTLAAAAGIELDWPAPGAAPDAEEVTAAREFMAPGADPAPAPIGLLAEHAPAALVGYRGLRESVYEGSGIDPKLIELALFAVMAADYVASHAGVHASRALAAGAGEAELVEAGLCAAVAAGMGAWLIAAAAIDNLDVP